MPFYEYQCKSCGHELEAMQKVSDAPLKKCPDCGKPQLTRLMSAPVFRLKGGGWYETDFKGDKENQRNLADKPEAPKEAKEPDAKSADDKAKDDKGKDGKDAKPAEAKADASSAKESASQEKPTGKPSDKSSAEGAPKAASGRRGGAARAVRSKRKPIKVKRRR
jgi:putative FmdB family regulatory protein